MVVKGVDKENWVTIRKIALRLRECTAMAAEMTGVCLLMGVIDLIWSTDLHVNNNINRCMKKIVMRDEVERRSGTF